jgi:hypothetical protein
MTEQSKRRACMWTAVASIFGGIPLAVLVTWIFMAGGKAACLERLEKTAAKNSEINQQQANELVLLSTENIHLKENDIALKESQHETRTELGEIRKELGNVSMTMSTMNGKLDAIKMMLPLPRSGNNDTARVPYAKSSSRMP